MRCYLALGSNLRSPARQLRRAIQQLRKLPQLSVIKIARFHHSKAWGRKIQPNFLNTVIEIHTSLTPEKLLKQCQKIECLQGRLRELKWSARTLDIDILLYGQKCIDKPGLSIPHPRMLERNFVLIPLLDIAPKVEMPDGTYVDLNSPFSN